MLNDEYRRVQVPGEKDSGRVHALWIEGAPDKTMCGQVESLDIVPLPKERIVTCHDCKVALKRVRQQRSREGTVRYQQRVQREAEEARVTEKSFETLAADYKRQRDELLEFMKSAPVSSGVCCCGDDMKAHSSPMVCGHNPVDMWDHAVLSHAEEIEKFDRENEQ